jgi:hypothetical protein
VALFKRMPACIAKMFAGSQLAHGGEGSNLRRMAQTKTYDQCCLVWGSLVKRLAAPRPCAIGAAPLMPPTNDHIDRMVQMGVQDAYSWGKRMGLLPPGASLHNRTSDCKASAQCHVAVWWVVHLLMHSNLCSGRQQLL